MTKPARISYAFIVLMLVAAAWLDLATPLITALFAFFTLEKLWFGRSKWLAIALFMVFLSAIFYGFVFFIREALVALPNVASTSIPMIIRYAEENGFNVPFEDARGLRTFVQDHLTTQLRYLGNFAKIATKESIFLIIGVVVAISLFLNSKMDLARDSHRLKNNLYSISCDEIAARFRSFYLSFATVMGAQIMISTINTILTSIFILAVKLPYAPVVIGVTFLCGILPIIGNLISNTVIVGIAFTISPKMAIAALSFLVILHKLEYFLNSKIIGDRIKNPVWLTLLGLILGERLMGIPGMILAPVILHYLKAETSQIEVAPTETGLVTGEPPRPTLPS